MDEEGEQTGQHAQVCTGCSDLAGAQDAAQDENKTGEHRGLLQLTAALFGSPTHHHNPARLHKPQSHSFCHSMGPTSSFWFQYPHFGPNILILVPSSLNLFSRAVTPSHATARADFTCFPFCPQQQHLLLLPIHACQALHYYTGKC